MMVTVQMEPSGALSSLSIKSTAPGLDPLEPCVRRLFEEQPYPAPEDGCIVVNVPMSFTLKEKKKEADAGP